jgi:hypothetical protein
MAAAGEAGEGHPRVPQGVLNLHPEVGITVDNGGVNIKSLSQETSGESRTTEETHLSLGKNEAAKERVG